MTKPVSYKRYRFPPEIVAHAVWLYFRFPLSLRLVEGMLLEREPSSPARLYVSGL
jgi:putative transposase